MAEATKASGVEGVGQLASSICMPSSLSEEDEEGAPWGGGRAVGRGGRTAIALYSG